MRINPQVINEAMERTECSSFDELGWKFLGKSGTTVRNYYSGKSTPSVRTLMVLKRITGRALDDMILENESIAA